MIAILHTRRWESPLTPTLSPPGEREAEGRVRGCAAEP